ncbi:MAG: DUF4149 domain-containing protein [Leptolyngbyaceae bacterium]|nr:DUF4149 domain-containing protein [Leptolyngbyaceae bacterium]
MSLNTSFSQSSSSSGRLAWQMVVLLTLAFWLGGSVLLDMVIMPGMYAAGMMSTPGFASAGYSIFWVFNRVELLCAATVLTGIFALRHYFKSSQFKRWTLVFAAVMMAIALFTTYWLTPEMSALGIHLSEAEAAAAVPAGMDLMHGSYFVLDFLKIAVGGVLLAICFRNMSMMTASKDNVLV